MSRMGHHREKGFDPYFMSVGRGFEKCYDWVILKAEGNRELPQAAKLA